MIISCTKNDEPMAQEPQQTSGTINFKIDGNIDYSENEVYSFIMNNELYSIIIYDFAGKKQLNFVSYSGANLVNDYYFYFDINKHYSTTKNGNIYENAIVTVNYKDDRASGTIIGSRIKVTFSNVKVKYYSSKRIAE